MSQLKQSGRALIETSSAFLFFSGPQQIMDAHSHREGRSVLPSPPFQMLMSFRHLQTHSEIMSKQVSGYPLS